MKMKFRYSWTKREEKHVFDSNETEVQKTHF
jgi:hypothetical protein